MSAVPTVQVVDDSVDGYKVINRSDFDPGVYQIYKPGKRIKRGKDSVNAEADNQGDGDSEE